MDRSRSSRGVRSSCGAPENRKEPYLAKNPAGQLPALELDDGSYLAEITAIPSVRSIFCARAARQKEQAVSQFEQVFSLGSCGKRSKLWENSCVEAPEG